MSFCICLFSFVFKFYFEIAWLLVLLDLKGLKRTEKEREPLPSTSTIYDIYFLLTSVVGQRRLKTNYNDGMSLSEGVRRFPTRSEGRAATCSGGKRQAAMGSMSNGRRIKKQ